jgi:hypothetical protein
MIKTINPMKSIPVLILAAFLFPKFLESQNGISKDIYTLG